MSSHLLALSIGPVQGFIAAARRTRDLWCGSKILSEVSKAAARAVAEAGGLLIFPALTKGDAELDRDSEFNVANIILAELPGDIGEPAKVAEKAEAAAQNLWKHEARKAVGEAGAFVDTERCNRQIEDVIEFYAAWAPLNGNYQAGRQRVMHLLAGRKTCRDFKLETIVARVPKSSLDGARDTVWKDEVWQNRGKIQSLNRALERRLRLSNGEQLDAVGLTKRLAFGPQPYPSVSRIAADPWLRGLAAAAKRNPAVAEVDQDLKEICTDLTKCGLGVLRADRFPQFADFPFEGTAVYRNRYKELTFEMGGDEQPANLVDRLGKKVSHLAGKLGEPEPYLAILVADGDHMGKLISGIESADRHREFSRMLARFAGMADEIVKDSHGCLVYSGGDDVLAFVPVDNCVKCAHELHKGFSEVLEPSRPSADSPTLSVGIAIGHFMEPLESLLEYGRAAEKAAKNPDRNGLAIHVHTRGGSPVKIRGQWRSGIVERLDKWRELYNEGRVSHKTPYDIRELARNYEGWPTSEDTVEAIRQDLLRLLNRKRPPGKDKLKDEDIDNIMRAVFLAEHVGAEPGAGHPGVVTLANELIVASRIVRAEQQAQGRKQDRTRGRT